MTDAFTATVVRHRDELQRHCERLLGSHADAEDALQETLLRAWKARRSLRASSPRPWLYAIATNACRDALSRREPTLTTLESADFAAPPHQQPDAAVLAEDENERALLTAIQLLPPRQHASLVMCDVLDWPAKRAAGALNTSLPATNSALQRARQGLRTHLESTGTWSSDAPEHHERATLRRYLAAIDAPDTEVARAFVAMYADPA